MYQKNMMRLKTRALAHWVMLVSGASATERPYTYGEKLMWGRGGRAVKVGRHLDHGHLFISNDGEWL